ncbi:MAG: aminotransferase class I/II-fold pyridoxal phosphate-dependent enzyme [Phaeovulum sp.]|uniref:aminotransferase class I/II-fold pyridoxal phosphate-dependent enzyme n=1 Tax=Phaeovulum sp. TaxID=2934796 RepID=UPI00272FF65D|nr:aminotransferase class I/II-fold pyridoxal phosphate-dependent enzyme [Phaeovulum sp.]MDP2063722.1 aminotransferase class I/II-fold pyridoxal phosphate-dependent enzyme [Phaeovulum sp.]
MNSRNDPKARAIAAARAAAGHRPGRAEPAVGGDGWPEAANFAQLADYRNIERMRMAGSAMGVANPYFRLHDGHATAQTVIDGRETINFASYDYVGLNADPRTAAAAKEAIDRYGVSPSGSRLVSGARPVHLGLEAALARHYGAAAAICFVSGHSTNVSTIGCLMTEGDLIVQDTLVHNSIQVGARLSGAARRSFAHNSMAALEALLIENRARYRNALIVVEGHYSMDGDTAPLAQLVALKRKYGCWLMVDEAHALGCVGATGKGVFEHTGVDPTEVDIWMGTLSKTLASTGGYIAGSAALIDLLMAHASGYVYSVALAPALAASALTALELLEAEPWRVRKLQDNTALFIRSARAAGLDTGAAEPFSIVPIMVGDSLVAAKLSERLLARGINALPVIFPAVPMQGARLRFFLTALHDAALIRAAVEATAEELQKLRDDQFGTAIPLALLNL